MLRQYRQYGFALADHLRRCAYSQGPVLDPVRSDGSVARQSWEAGRTLNLRHRRPDQPVRSEIGLGLVTPGYAGVLSISD